MSFKLENHSSTWITWYVENTPFYFHLHSNLMTVDLPHDEWYKILSFFCLWVVTVSHHISHHKLKQNVDLFEIWNEVKDRGRSSFSKFQWWIIKTDFEYHLVFRRVSLLFMEEKEKCCSKSHFLHHFKVRQVLKKWRTKRMHFGTLFWKLFRQLYGK